MNARRDRTTWHHTLRFFFLIEQIALLAAGAGLKSEKENGKR